MSNQMASDSMEAATGSTDKTVTTKPSSTNSRLQLYPYRESKVKSQVVKCRFCEKEMKFQNYEQHLKSKHPTENCKDLRSKTDKSIKSMFTGKRSCHDQNISVDEPPKKKVSTLSIDSNHNLAIKITDSVLGDSPL